MLKTSIFNYDVYYPHHNWPHSKHLAKQLKCSKNPPELPVSTNASQQKIKAKQASLEDFMLFFELSISEQKYLQNLSPVEIAIAQKNFYALYGLTNNLKNALENYDTITDFCLAALQNKSGNVQNLFIKLSELIKTTFSIVEIIQKLRKIQQQPVFYETYDQILQNETFSVENTLQIFQILRQFSVFQIGSDDEILNRFEAVGEDFSSKMLFGVGKLGRLLHVGILRMLSYKTGLPACGKYYCQALLEDGKVLEKFQDLIVKVEDGGFRMFTVSIRNKIDVVDVFEVKEEQQEDDFMDDFFDIAEMRDGGEKKTFVTENDDFEDE